VATPGRWSPGGQAGNWYSDDLKTANFDDPGHVDFLQQIADMRCKDHSIPQAGDSMGQGDAWRNGLVAMTIGHHSQSSSTTRRRRRSNSTLSTRRPARRPVQRRGLQWLHHPDQGTAPG